MGFVRYNGEYYYSSSCVRVNVKRTPTVVIGHLSSTYGIIRDVYGFSDGNEEKFIEAEGYRFVRGDLIAEFFNARITELFWNYYGRHQVDFQGSISYSDLLGSEVDRSSELYDRIFRSFSSSLGLTAVVEENYDIIEEVEIGASAYCIDGSYYVNLLVPSHTDYNQYRVFEIKTEHAHIFEALPFNWEK
jgi:hypothetical protein